MLSDCADMSRAVARCETLEGVAGDAVEGLEPRRDERGKKERQHAKTHSCFFASTLYHEAANDAS
jgi:hypothetical protein